MTVEAQPTAAAPAPGKGLSDADIRSGRRALDAFAGGVQLYYRASEVQETYFYLFILLYLIALRRRLLAARTRGSDRGRVSYRRPAVREATAVGCGGGHDS